VRWKIPGFSGVAYGVGRVSGAERRSSENCKAQLTADVWIRGWHPKEVTGTDDVVRAVRPACRSWLAGERFSKDPEGALKWATRWRRREGIEVFMQAKMRSRIGKRTTSGPRRRRLFVELVFSYSQQKAWASVHLRSEPLPEIAKKRDKTRSEKKDGRLQARPIFCFPFYVPGTSNSCLEVRLEIRLSADFPDPKHMRRLIRIQRHEVPAATPQIPFVS